MKIATPTLIKLAQALFLSLVLSSAGYAELLIDTIAAVVEDSVITENELIQRMAVIRAQASDQAQFPSDSVFLQQVLNRMITERLQITYGSRRGIEVDELQLDRAMQELAERNRMTLEEFRQTLLQKKIDYISFREQVRTEMLVGQVRRRAVESKIKISDQEINELLEQQKNSLNLDVEYRIAHILVQLPTDPTPEQLQEAKAKVEQVEQLAQQGDSFTQLAIRYSQSQDALEGGDLGWRNRDQIPAIFADHLDGLTAGDLSKVVRSPNGLHLFKVIDTRGNKTVLIEQMRSRHILLRVNAVRSDDDALRDLTSLRSRIVNGADFSELARANSDDPGTAVNGGTLDWVAPSALAPSFRETAARLTIGQISEPFKSRFGWHILEVLERRQHDNSEDARREKARGTLRQRKIEEETDLWIRQLVDESYVDNRLLANDTSTAQ
jgi:peptidyl-prolyl cis-trans isomerase SurA|tara:strand:- start:18990 stop:20309 length:1320 start_codon:yes stop_codon:yes gene_type:complete